MVERLRNGEISVTDAIRRHGIICDWNDYTFYRKRRGNFVLP